MADDVGGAPPGDGAIDRAEPLLNRAQLAAIFNKSENTIDKWRLKGMPVEVEGGNGVPYGFLFSDCRAWYDETQARDAAEKKAADDFVNQQRMAFLGQDRSDPKAGLSPQAIRDMAQAELIYMQAARQRGALIPVEDVVDLLERIFSEVRAGLDNLPDWLEREFSLTGDQVSRAVAYNDGLLRAMSEAIAEAGLLDAAPDDGGEGGLF